jgi:hypothetical protein
VSEAFRGAAGSGSLTVYTVPRAYALRLELLTFTLTTDATVGVHSALVAFTDGVTNLVTARIWDWNEGGPSMTLYYTYGIGLRPFNCTVTTGMMIPNNLPDTLLAPQTAISVSAVHAAGATIAGDAIGSVALYGDLFSTVEDTGEAVPLVPGFLPAGVD